MPSRLADRVCLVTGATGGIGRATVARLADEGAVVIVSDLDRSVCEAVAAECAGQRTLALTLDVTAEQAWRSAIADIRREFGALHVLVNNAGVGSGASVEAETAAGWERVVEVTQKGVWLGMKHAGPAISAAGGGSIVNVCSILATVGGFGTNIAYHAAKGAVRAMTKSAALHWAPVGVRVNSIHPGFVDTAQTRARLAGTAGWADRIAGTPMARFGQPAEVAAGIAYLASDDASFVTGSELYVDGGWTAR